MNNQEIRSPCTQIYVEGLSERACSVFNAKKKSWMSGSGPVGISNVPEVLVLENLLENIFNEFKKSFGSPWDIQMHRNADI